MAENSKIEWTDDTVSFWWGCTRYGEGCRHCYAEKLSKRSGDFWGPQAPRLWIKSALAECERLNRKAEREGKSRLVFINSMSDFFEQHDGPVVDRQGQRLYNFEGGYKLFSPTANVGGINPTTLDDLRREAFETFDRCDWLRFLLLTKRPENIRRMWADIVCDSENWFFDPEEQKRRGLTHAGPHKSKPILGNYPRKNVWLGASVSTQADADRNIPLLLKCRDLAPVLFLSIEPLLGPVDLTNIGEHDGRPLCCLANHPCVDDEPGHGIDWVIVGGESGHGARECNIEWFRSIVDQCKAARVACFVKQLGARPFSPHAGIEWKAFDPVYDDLLELDDRKGGDWSEWPEDLKVREFPKLEAAR